MNKSRWILLAEDDEIIAELTNRALAADSHLCDVIVAHDGVEVLDVIRHHGNSGFQGDGNPVFVLLDLNMPKVDGFEVLHQIKSDASMRAIPVVMFTSSADTTDIERSYQLGANAYVVKPANYREFSQAVQRLCWFWGGLNEPPREALAGKSPHP